MIDSVLELVNKTTSNSLFMFLFCNFIIILILVGNSKPGSQDKPNPGYLQPMFISDSVPSSKPGFEKSESVPSSKPGFEKPMLMTISSTTCLEKSVLNSESVLSSKSGYEKYELVPPSKPVLISESNLTSRAGLQECGLISKAALSSNPVGSERSLTSKPGLRVMKKPGSNCSEKDEKGRMRKAEMKKVRFEENESEVECALRRRVEEFILKINSQWKSENAKSNYLLI